MKVFPFEIINEEYPGLMKKLEVSSRGTEIMKGRFGMKSFMISNISTPAANVLKQHVISLGGEAAVPAYSVNCSKPKADLVFAVRTDRLHILISKLKEQCWKLPQVAETLERHLQCNPPWFNFSHKGIDTSGPLVMGVLNVTPDSFSDGGKFATLEKAIEQAERMISDGVDIIDIGGESTRPGAENVDAGEEIKRVVPVINEIRKRGHSLNISIDTSKQKVAQAALEAGADIINDISGLNFDPKMRDFCGANDVPVIIMHIQGTPGTMQKKPEYDNIFTEISEYFDMSIEQALSKGVKREKIIIDPGIGFGKNLFHNLSLIKHLEVFQSFELPVLAGLSRKSMIGLITGRNEPSDRVAGTIALNMSVLLKGAAMIRVHDVSQAKDTVAIYNALKETACF